MQAAINKEHMNFQAEAKQLLKLMIHSLYSNKEIFLRELISNASDAADKLRFEGLTDGALFENDSDLKIRVSYDKTARTITISDNGIGMSRQEVIDNIGTIAKSGTREFFNSLTGDQAKDAHLIGQFGVGFYSAFIVADKVILVTRRAGLTAEHGVRWESSGEGDYTLETVDKKDRGTEIILHLREGEDELLSGLRLRSIIRRYSDHITLPIIMKKEEWSQESNEYRITDEDETINQASALWARPKSEITQEQYEEFYKHVAHDFEPPLTYVHSRVEGKQEYTLLLYIPSRAPFDLFDRERRQGIKLYVRRVFIMDDAEKLLPNYLRFVRGIIDSNDLPLNVSREILQESKDIDNIRAGSVKKMLGLIEDLASSDKEEDCEKFKTFWKEFGQVLKEGVGEDYANRERIAKLLRFVSTSSETDEQTVSLDNYIARMKEGQDKIYYVTADSLKAARSSPHLEIFRKKGIEVLLLSDRVDEWLVANLTEYNGKQLQSIAKGSLDLGKLEDEAEKKEYEKEADEYKELVTKMKEVLGERIKDVRVTFRLTESPACLVVDAHDMSGNLERLLKSAGQKVPNTKPILEINPHHPMVQRLKYEEAKFSDWSNILFDQALLAEGGQLEDPASFVRRLNDLLLQNVLSGK
ncbi:molecular chaperone HtpG [Nitrosomonas nitrosa]|jgi:molecular chaperone HtpG|uniref:Chaperone protein HtpG n=1 Tax=Nitrosomonas nitrosa TaxID=52442 RepID=A0A1I4LK20_9PROT|nr:molecular chaperone HtpG [Nitrosomonas nitrosa]PTR04909.1 molecular chaperone HtpG [Nitrosomonas nitrosa]CAE6485969.1 molecular chaperone HSP90 family [Nitrosomonas nitrosa]SFL90947.1 molecular chaperone HtpG [Nitrosomonas nitrosa]